MLIYFFALRPSRPAHRTGTATVVPQFRFQGRRHNHGHGDGRDWVCTLPRNMQHARESPANESCTTKVGATEQSEPHFRLWPERLLPQAQQQRRFCKSKQRCPVPHIGKQLADNHTPERRTQEADGSAGQRASSRRSRFHSRSKQLSKRADPLECPLLAPSRARASLFLATQNRPGVRRKKAFSKQRRSFGSKVRSR